MARFSVFSGVLILASSTLLVACGGEREEPFNPPEEPDEFREPVTSFVVYDNISLDSQRPDPETYPDGKRLQVIDNEDDFEALTEAYLALDDTVSSQNFEEGQVLLYDGGWRDESRCEQPLELRRMEPYFITEEEDLIEVVLTYRRIEADEDAICNEEELRRPFEFRYIESRADIVFVEHVQGISDDNDDSSNSSRSSASSSSESTGF